MSASPPRMELLIDIFALRGQRALAQPTLTPPELVAAVLAEFRELEHLGDDPAGYELRRTADGQPLDGESSLGQQLSAGERLLLCERELPLPRATQRPSRPIYLREQDTGKLYRLAWQPALIGRPDESQANHDWLAVNLAAHNAGLRVSRRHAQVVEENGQFFLEQLAQNPTVVCDSEGRTTTVSERRQPLRSGDTILLERSQIALKFIVRDEEPTP